MSDRLRICPVTVRVDGGNSEGKLVLVDGSLVAVLVKVSADDCGDAAEVQGWFLEAGFGPCGTLSAPIPEVFGTVGEAVDWIQLRLDAHSLR